MPQRKHFNPRSSSNALATLIRLRAAKLHPDPFAVAAAIKESSSPFPGPALALSLHAFSVKLNLSSSIIVEKSLMHMYSKFSMMADSCRVFDNMGRRDSASWNVLLSGYARPRLHVEAMRLFYRMHACGDPDIEPNPITLAVVLPVCAKTGSVKLGMSVHGYGIKKGFESETLMGNALVSMYAKCGGGNSSVISDAVAAFRAIGFKDVVSWNSIVAGFSVNGLYSEAIGMLCEMVSMGFRPNSATVVSVLPVCAFVPNGRRHGKEIHCHALRFALDADVSLCNALVIHYSKVGDVGGAESVFERMNSRDVVTWNTVISGYAMNGYPARAMDLFREFTSSGGMRPDSVTLITILRVCAELRDLEEGRRIHDYILRHPFLLQETSLGNALISFYGKCGEADTAMEIFMGLPEKDLISWNAALDVLADNAQWGKLVELVYLMNLVRVRPDSITIMSILQACGAFLDTRKVREAHGFSLRAGFTIQPTVGNSILDAYAKCGDNESTCKHFESLVEKNVITGNTMISGYLNHGRLDDAEKIFDEMIDRDLTTSNLMLQVCVRNDRIDRAFDLFREMQEEEEEEGMRPDKVSIMNVLAASGRLASARLVKQCHGYTIRSSLDDLQLNGALLDTYSKCGSIDDATRMFGVISEKDLVTFTAMVSGYSMHGMAKEAVGVFNEMFRLGIKPDHIFFTSLLSACSHAGLADEAWKHFKSITEVYGMRPTMEHYACLVDLLARSGRIKEAYGLLNEMPFEANAGMWGSLLGSCKTHGEVEIGRVAADHLFNVEDENIGNYVVMSNIYAADGRWDGVEKVRRLMKSKGVRKPAGCSWIEIDKSRHVFVADDLCHPRRWVIYNLLESLNLQLRVTASEELTDG